MPAVTVRQEQMNRMADGLNRPVVMPCERHWIEILMVDEAGDPVANAEYEIELPDGTLVRGCLDADGMARFDNIVGGNCVVTFPKLDSEAWKKQSP